MAVAPMATPASLYVGDLHHDVTDGQLFDAFSEFKSLTSVRVCRDSSTGRSLCYGYVNFISSQDGISTYLKFSITQTYMSEILLIYTNSLTKTAEYVHACM